MAGQWYFKPIAKGETIREPTAGAFFASDSISDPGFALVREGIQNALDAAIKGQTTVVRISLVNERSAPAWSRILPYFSDAWKHFGARTSGLPSEELPNEGDPCPLLVFEDFGTSGLLGDPATPYPPKDTSKNNFFHFFRAEGRTDKDPGERGSWGLGKDTFFRASSINTIFGLTIRDADQRRMLMGKIVLKSHYLGDEYCQDGYFGIRPDIGEHFVMPIEDSYAVGKFLELFPLERRRDSGLSIVVPWPDPEISEEKIIQSVVRNYFYTILAGDLDVMVETAGIQTLFDESSLPDEMLRISDVVGDLPLVRLAQWAVKGDRDSDRCELNMPDPQRAWAWDQSLFASEDLAALREKLQNKEAVAVRVPVTVRKRGVAHEQSYFDAYMKLDDSNERVRPVFIRDGIVISDVRAQYMRGLRALVVVDDKPLSAFLQQAENPSHTLWQGGQVKKEYLSGVSNLRFVRESVRRIYDILTAEDKEEDKQLLADLFPVPGSGSKGGATPPPPQPPPPRPPYFTINSTRSGFTIASGPARLPVGSRVEIRTAYDTRRGSPLSKYRIEDFRLDEPPIDCQESGCEITEIVDNRIVGKVVEPDKFRIVVTGFDSNRQIYVQADRTEDQSDASSSD